MQDEIELLKAENQALREAAELDHIPERAIGRRLEQLATANAGLIEVNAVQLARLVSADLRIADLERQIAALKAKP